MPTAIAQHALSSSESNILFETTTTDMAWSSHSTSTVAVSSSTTSGAATSTAPVAADTTSSALFSSLSASSIPHGIDALVVQKENQLICIQKQQRLQQQQQRQLLFRHQQQYQQRQQKSLPCHSSQFGFQQLRNSASVGAAAPGASPHADSCIVLNGSDTTSTSGLSLHSSSRAKNSGGLTMRVDLVDDVWRIIFYILARNCKDLGRSMQVNRRFYSLIANDAVLWKLTYNLTVSGSVFAIQKHLPSPPTSISTNCQPQEGQHHRQHRQFLIGEESQPRLPLLSRSQNPTRTEDNNEEGPLFLHANGMEPKHARSASLEDISLLNSRTETFGSAESKRKLSTITPGLQMPSPLVLPHHRRIVQKMATTHSIIYNDGSNVNMNISPGAGNTVQPIPIVDRSIVPELHSNPQASSTHTSPTGNETLFTAMMRTPASTPSISNVSSFQSTIPPSVSQVISSSTTPLTMIQHHIPTTTLMHHPPAVYWKHQVVEWLEQEKLRCLRLGLFWRFNAAAASAHAERKLRGTH